MKLDPYFVSLVNHKGAYFTESGIYKALMKSNKPIADKFQKEVCEVLKTLRKERLKTIEE